MGGKAHGGRTVTRAEVFDLVNQISPCILEKHTEIVVAGSYRRDKKTCGDIDIVIIPDMTSNESTQRFDKFCQEHFGLQKNGKKIARSGLIDGIQVEFYVATSENMGSQVQMWTGSMYHNIKLRRKAKDLGYTLSQYGFRHLETKELVTCPLEIDVYNFLKMDYVATHKR